jgi:hypothetical protein
MSTGLAVGGYRLPVAGCRLRWSEVRREEQIRELACVGVSGLGNRKPLTGNRKLRVAGYLLLFLPRNSRRRLTSYSRRQRYRRTVS